MPNGLPRITAKQAIAAITKIGFYISRQSGSHRIYKNKNGKRITIPFHADKILHPKIVKAIIKDTGLSDQEFRQLI